jgi:hypothetical protein
LLRWASARGRRSFWALRGGLMAARFGFFDIEPIACKRNSIPLIIGMWFRLGITLAQQSGGHHASGKQGDFYVE